MDKLSFLRPISLRGKIRLGEKRDGGYVVYSKLLPKTDALISYGVGWEISFEEDFNNLTNKKVLMFDPTMFGKNLMAGEHLKRLLARFRLGEAFRYLFGTWELWQKKKELEKNDIFFINEGVARSRFYKYDTFTNHIDRFSLQNKKLLLKIDIEGNEYEIFEDKGLYKWLQQATQIIIEFHDLKNRLHDLKEIVDRMGRDFVLAHIHVNNFADTFRIYDFTNKPGADIIVPDVIELLFVKRDQIEEEDLMDEIINYPIHGLDYPNNPNARDHRVNFI